MNTITRPVYLNSIFDSFFNDNWFESPRSLLEAFSAPQYPHNIFIKDDLTMVLEVAATGRSEKDIKVEFDNGVLTVTIGNEKEVDEKSEENREYICHKLVQRQERLAYTISDKYDADKTKVKLENGLLTVTIPVKEEAKPVKKIFQIE